MINDLRQDKTMSDIFGLGFDILIMLLVVYSKVYIAMYENVIIEELICNKVL